MVILAAVLAAGHHLLAAVELQRVSDCGHAGPEDRGEGDQGALLLGAAVPHRRVRARGGGAGGLVGAGQLCRGDVVDGHSFAEENPGQQARQGSLLLLGGSAQVAVSPLDGGVARAGEGRGGEHAARVQGLLVVPRDRQAVAVPGDSHAGAGRETRLRGALVTVKWDREGEKESEVGYVRKDDDMRREKCG